MALKDVPGLSPKTFEQAAGFLRARDGDNPLDSNPERYDIAQAVLERVGLTTRTRLTERRTALTRLQEQQSPGILAAELGAGILILSDILEQLIRPGRDPRESLPAPIPGRLAAGHVDQRHSAERGGLCVRRCGGQAWRSYEWNLSRAALGWGGRARGRRMKATVQEQAKRWLSSSNRVIL